MRFFVWGRIVLGRFSYDLFIEDFFIETSRRNLAPKKFKIQLHLGSKVHSHSFLILGSLMKQ